LAATWDRGPLVKALQSLRGVEFVTAVTVVASSDTIVGAFRSAAVAARAILFASRDARTKFATRPNVA